MTSPKGFAWDYDQEATRYHWHGPEVLFGLMFEFIERGQLMLDLGIGTGLSSLPFHTAGLSICGIDGSDEMLAVCRSKDIATELERWDISQAPLPYEDGTFDHVIASGVFHFLEDLETPVSEAARILKRQGLFGFTFETHFPGAPEAKTIRAGDVSKWVDEESGTDVFRHSEGYVTGRLADSGFTVLKTLEFVATVHPDTGKKIVHKALVTKKSSDPSKS